MTEDDTFRVLRRESYPATVKKVLDFINSQKGSEGTGLEFRNTVDTYCQQHKWTIDELLYEGKLRVSKGQKC